MDNFGSPQRTLKPDVEIADMFRIPIQNLTGHRLEDLIPPPPKGEYRGTLLRGEETAYESTPSIETTEKILTYALQWANRAWEKVFADIGLEYHSAKLVLYRDKAYSGCDEVLASRGPIYCPNDDTVYIDPSFVNTLKEQWKGPNDIAMLYVVFHETAHHVQNLLGQLEHIFSAKARLTKDEYLRLCTAMELQAEYLAGLSFHEANENIPVLRETDPESLYWFVAMLGADLTHLRTSGKIVYSDFTHGTSQQRSHMFWSGLTQGDFETGTNLELFAKYLMTAKHNRALISKNSRQ